MRKKVEKISQHQLSGFKNILSVEQIFCFITDLLSVSEGSCLSKFMSVIVHISEDPSKRWFMFLRAHIVRFQVAEGYTQEA